MCPSYRVTREEEHSTRGRAHLLWEMTNGYVAPATRRQSSGRPAHSSNPISDGWRNDAVKQSLDLCLSCKGCKSDCPTGVDVATYKAEFLSHYYETNRRPLSALAFANIDLCAHAASHVPGLINLTTQFPGLSDLAKLAAGVPSQRRIPRFASKTFQQQWEKKQREARPRSMRAQPRTSSAGNSSAGDSPGSQDRAVFAGWGGSPAVERATRPLTHEPHHGATGVLARPAERSSPTVLLWADTFNNHFQPSTAIAAAESSKPLALGPRPALSSLLRTPPIRPRPP